MAGPQKATSELGISTRKTRSTTKISEASTTDEQSTSPLQQTVKSRRQQVVVVEVAVKTDNSINVASATMEKRDAGNKTGNITAQDGDGVAVAESLHGKENIPPTIRYTRAERLSRRKQSNEVLQRIESDPEISTPAEDAQRMNSQKDHEPSATVVVEENTEITVKIPAVVSTNQKSPSKKRKWSRPTRVVKLENEDDESVEACSDTETEDDKGEDRMDSDGEYGVRKRQTNGSSQPKRVKAGRNQEQELSEYERLRLENIRRNQEMLQFLQLPSVANEIQMAIIEGKPVDAIAALGEKTDGTLAPVRIKRQSVKRAPTIVQPVRTSNRIRGVAVTPLEIGENDMLDPEARSQTQSGSNRSAIKSESDDEGSDRDDEDPANLMSGDLFFDKETRDRAIRVDGHYKGWLNSEVMVKYGFEKSAEDAWEANGGGTFSFSDPSGSSAAGSSKKSSRRPKHDAKMVAKAMFKKNPNSFFYRHNEPGQVVLPEGLVFDPNYEYTSRGKPIYCGKYNQRRN
ncbi:hypothetical protein EC968_008561 [Mortierella alpina]|nr:hypothetical protein EC968_008561 [Mortierella alpina]